MGKVEAQRDGTKSPERLAIEGGGGVQREGRSGPSTVEISPETPRILEDVAQKGLAPTPKGAGRRVVAAS